MESSTRVARKGVKEGRKSFSGFFRDSGKYVPIRVLFDTTIRLNTEDARERTLHLFLAQVEAMENELTLKDMEDFVYLMEFIHARGEPKVRLLIARFKDRVRHMLKQRVIASLNDYPLLKRCLEE